MPKAASLAKTLAHLVIEALAKIGLTQDDILAGQIEFTDLPWQVPPLVVEDTLFGVPFSNYIDQVLYVNSDKLVELWSDAMLQLKNHPFRVATHEGYLTGSGVLPHVKIRERGLYLSLPEGFPLDITDLAATTLSMECAHILRHNTKLVSFMADENNYFAQLESGFTVGIKDGLPAMYPDIWDIPSTGMVEEMLRMPRGDLFEGCDYDILAKVRSLAHTYSGSIRDFVAVDWAIQALRVLQGQKELLQEVYGIKRTAHVRKVRLTALNEAVEAVERISLTDRQRIEMLKHLLVPEVMTSGQFSTHIYPFSHLPPPVMTDKVLNRVKEAVKQLHNNEELLYAPDPRPARSV